MSHLTESIERLRILANDPTHPLTTEWLADQCGCDAASMRHALAGDLAQLPDGHHQFIFELAKGIKESANNGIDLAAIVAGLPAGRPRHSLEG